MFNEKDPRVYIQELPSQSSFASQRPIVSRHESSAPPNLWPSEPQILRETKLSKWINILYDAALCIAPVLLITKICVVIWASRHGHTDTAWIADLNSQLGTIYTIIFMTTIATLFKRFALWKAQEGATVAELEQYQASISLPATMKMIVLLRAFNLTSIGLLLLWSWFYIGSQAVGREIAKVVSLPYNSSVVVFPRAEAPSLFQHSLTSMELLAVNAAFAKATQTTFQDYLKLYAAAAADSSSSSFISPGRADLRNAALIPTLDQTYYSGLDDPNSLGWRKLDDAQGPIDFSSYVGIPVLHADGISSFIGKYTMHTSYIWPDCSDVIFSGASSFPTGKSSAFTTVFHPTNITANGFPTVDVWTINEGANSTIRGRCTLGRKHVEALGRCDITRCGIDYVRLDTIQNTTTTDTPFTDNPDFTQRFFDNLLTSMGTPQDLELMPSVLSVGVTYGQTDEGTPGWIGGSSISLQLTMSQKLGYLINTYLAASQNNSGLYSTTLAWSNIKTPRDEILQNKTQNVFWDTADSYGGAYSPQWVLVPWWIVLDFVTCAILLVGAFASVWLRQRTVCPDVFGYISSMTRDNPHIPVPKGGSTMSGSERARAMKNVRVKIGELERQDGTPGHIGLALEHPEIPLDRLRRKGEYL